MLAAGAFCLWFLSGDWLPKHEPEITPTKQAVIVNIGHYIVPDEYGSTSCCFIELDNGESYRFPDYRCPELTVAQPGDTIFYYTEDNRFRLQH